MTLGPICSTLVDVEFCQEAALLCAKALVHRDVPARRHASFRSDQGDYLHEAHRLLCLVASSSPPSNDAAFGDAARSTPR